MYGVLYGVRACVYKQTDVLGQGRVLWTRKVSFLAGHHRGYDGQKQWNVCHRGQEVLGGGTDE